MSGSGVRTGMVVTAVVHRLILRVQVVALTAFCVAVAVAAMRGAVASLFVAATVPAAVTTTAASALSVPLSKTRLCR